jgi:rhodanese-related sulfurtransferase
MCPRLLLYALFVPMVLAASARADEPKPGAFVRLDAAAARALVEADAKAAKDDPAHKPLAPLDVRTAAEFESGHLHGAKNLDSLSAGFKASLAALDKSRPYLLYCARGNRSAKVFDLMKELGFSRVTHLDGGIRAWTSAGGPVTTETGGGTQKKDRP